MSIDTSFDICIAVFGPDQIDVISIRRHSMPILPSVFPAFTHLKFSLRRIHFQRYFRVSSLFDVRGYHVNCWIKGAITQGTITVRLAKSQNHPVPCVYYVLSHCVFWTGLLEISVHSFTSSLSLTIFELCEFDL